MRIPFPFAARERARIDSATIGALEIAARCRSIDEILQFWVEEIADAVHPDEACVFRQDGERWIRIVPIGTNVPTSFGARRAVMS